MQPIQFKRVLLSGTFLVLSASWLAGCGIGGHTMDDLLGNERTLPEGDEVNFGNRHTPILNPSTNRSAMPMDDHADNAPPVAVRPADSVPQRRAAQNDASFAGAASSFPPSGQPGSERHVPVENQGMAAGSAGSGTNAPMASFAASASPIAPITPIVAAQPVAEMPTVATQPVPAAQAPAGEIITLHRPDSVTPTETAPPIAAPAPAIAQAEPFPKAEAAPATNTPIPGGGPSLKQAVSAAPWDNAFAAADIANVPLESNAASAPGSDMKTPPAQAPQGEHSWLHNLFHKEGAPSAASAPVTASAAPVLSSVPPMPDMPQKEQAASQYSGLVQEHNQSETARAQLMNNSNATVMTSPQNGQLVDNPGAVSVTAQSVQNTDGVAVTPPQQSANGQSPDMQLANAPAVAPSMMKPEPVSAAGTAPSPVPAQADNSVFPVGTALPQPASFKAQMTPEGKEIAPNVILGAAPAFPPSPIDASPANTEQFSQPIPPASMAAVPPASEPIPLAQPPETTAVASAPASPVAQPAPPAPTPGDVFAAVASPSSLAVPPASLSPLPESQAMASPAVASAPAAPSGSAGADSSASLAAQPPLAAASPVPARAPAVQATDTAQSGMAIAEPVAVTPVTPLDSVAQAPASTPQAALDASMQSPATSLPSISQVAATQEEPVKLVPPSDTGYQTRFLPESHYAHRGQDSNAGTN